MRSNEHASAQWGKNKVYVGITRPPASTPGSGAGDVTAAASITDNALVRGDGGAKGIQKTGIIIDDFNNVSFINGHNIIFSIGDQTVTDADGENFETYASKANGTGKGGRNYVVAGEGGATGPGGDVGIFGGQGGATSGAGGDVFVQGGNVTEGKGGDIYLNAGVTAGSGDNNGGAIYLVPTAPTGAGVAKYTHLRDPASQFDAILDTSLLTSVDRTYQFPNADGIFALSNQVMPGQTVILTSDVVNNNAVANTIQDVTGLEFPINAGSTYWFRYTIFYDAAATTTGSRWSVNGPAKTLLAMSGRWTLAATTATINHSTSYDSPAASNATSLTTGNVATIEGFITPSASGTLIARFASEVAASAITAKAGSIVQYQQVL